MRHNEATQRPKGISKQRGCGSACAHYRAHPVRSTWDFWPARCRPTRTQPGKPLSQPGYDGGRRRPGDHGRGPWLCAEPLTANQAGSRERLPLRLYRDGIESAMACSTISAGAAHPDHDDAEHLEDAAHLVGEANHTADQLGASAQRGANLVSPVGLPMGRPIPAQAQDRREPFGVVLVVVVDPHREGGAGSTRVQADDGKGRLPQGMYRPWRERAGLQAQGHGPGRYLLLERGDDHGGVGQALAAPDPLSLVIQHAMLISPGFSPLSRAPRGCHGTLGPARDQPMSI
jgi:hypothetical protein